MQRMSLARVAIVAMVLAVAAFVVVVDSTPTRSSTRMTSTTKNSSPFPNLRGRISLDGPGILAGVAKVNASLPIGVPLAGFNHGDRRVKHWPIPDPKEYTFYMTPSIGRLDETWARAIVLRDPSGNTVAFVAYDAIGADEGVNADAFAAAQSLGSKIPLESITFSASHSHSGPGAVSKAKLWELAPATDLFKQELRTLLSSKIGAAIYEAEQNLRPAAVGYGMGFMGYPYTVNRRSRISPVMSRGSVDPHVGILRVDDLSSGTATPMAVLWNFAIHGVCYSDDNMFLASDIMGITNRFIEGNTTGLVSLFVNSDAGDVDPGPGACNNAPDFVGSSNMQSVIMKVYHDIQPTTNVQVLAVSQVVSFGKTDMNLTLERLNNCSSGGPLDICSICKVLKCDANLHLDEDWVDNTPRFTAAKLVFDDSKSLVIVTAPGEPLVELGWWVKNDTLATTQADDVFFFGYTNNHMGYFATPVEYDAGGYESVLSLWGVDTALKVRGGVAASVQLLLDHDKRRT